MMPLLCHCYVLRPGTNFYVTGINLKVLSCHFSHKTGRLAAEGKYEEAEQYAAACIRDLEGDELLPSWLAFIICNGEAVYTLLSSHLCCQFLT